MTTCALPNTAQDIALIHHLDPTYRLSARFFLDLIATIVLLPSARACAEGPLGRHARHRFVAGCCSS